MDPRNSMRACVEELLLMMFMIVRGPRGGDFSEDGDWATYPGVSISDPIYRAKQSDGY